MREDPAISQADSGAMDVAVLGPLLVNGEPAGLAHRDRVVLAALATHPGQPLSRDALADALWGDEVPESAAKVVQGCVLRLRRILGPAAIETTASGYLLRLHADGLDSARFERLVAQARERLGDGEPDRAAYLVDQALALWRGDPLADLEEWQPGRLQGERLTELLLDAQDIQTQAALELGRHREVLGEALLRAEQAPLRERRWELAVLAQYRCGRQGDALRTLRRAKVVLATELGLDPGPDLTELEGAILNQDPALVTAPAATDPSPECPYPGLLPFGVGDEATFFGRETDVAACLDLLDSAQVLAVVGPSGCGKSSLVRAGVAARLQREGREVVVMTPGPHLRDISDGEPFSRPAGRVVLVVDQFEEALSEHLDPQDRDAWVGGLLEHAARGGALVLGLRSDRVGALAAYPGLSRIVERGLYLLGAMTEPDLRAAIEGPAAQAGLRLEPGLTDLVVRDVHGEPGALPLLSHVMRQTWLRREGATLTVQGYHASGGVRQAVAQSADGLYERLDGQQRALLRDLMLRLVALAPDGEPMRARLRRSLLAADRTREALVEQLVAARLVSADEQSVEIAHEALAREWPRLRAWLDEDVEGQLILRHLAFAADTWDGMGRPSSELYRGVRLDRALEWRTLNAPALSAVETAFLDASQAAADADRQKSEEDARRQKQTNRRLRVLLAAAVAFALVAAVLGSVASTSARRAETQAVTADARRVGAEALTAPMPDTSLLLAAAGMRLEHNSDAAKGNLAAALDRSPLLAHVTRTPPAGAIAVNPRTGQVAVSLTGGGVNLYDGRTLRQVGHATQGGGYAIEYSPDGRLLAANDTPHDVSLAPDPRPIHLLSPTGSSWPTQLGGIRQPSRSFWSMGFSSDGRRFASVFARDTAGLIDLSVWDVHDPSRPVTVINPDNAHMTAVALSADGRTLFTGGDYFLRVFDVTTGRLRTTRTGSQLGLGPLPFHDQGWTPQVVMSPDGQTLAVTSETEIALLDAATLTPKARVTAHGRITSLSFSADNRRLALTDGQVSVWDLVGKRPVHVFPSPDSDDPRPTEVFRSQTWGGEATALSPTGDTVYAANSDGLVLTWDLTGSHGFVTARPASALPNDAVAVQVSGDGTKVGYLANIDARIDVRDIATGRLTQGTSPSGNNVFGGALAWRPDGKAVLEASGDYSVQVRDPISGKLLMHHGFGDAVSAAQYTHDGHLIVGTNQGTMQVLDATSLNFKAGVLKPFIKERIVTLALDPAEHAVALEGSTQRVLVDYTTLHRLRTLPYLTFFAPDGSSSAVVDVNGAVGFQTDHGTRWTTTPDPSHAYGDTASAYSHNSTWFASSRNGQVALWNARTGTFVGSVPVTGPVAVGFTTDDSTLVIAGIDGSVRTWNLRPDSWIKAACSIAARDLTVQEWNTVLPHRAPQHVCQGSS